MATDSYQLEQWFLTFPILGRGGAIPIDMAWDRLSAVMSLVKVVVVVTRASDENAWYSFRGIPDPSLGTRLRSTDLEHINATRTLAKGGRD